MPTSPSLNPATSVTGNNSAATATTTTLTTTVANTVIIACVGYDSSSSTIAITGVASVTGGLAFNHLIDKTTSAQSGLSLWWLGSAGTFSDTVRATFNATPGNGIIHAFGVQGCAGITLGTAFDPNVALPASNTNTTSPAAVTYSTTNSDDLIINVFAMGSPSGGAVSTQGPPTGFTQIRTTLNNNGAGSVNLSTSLLSVSAPQSGASASTTLTGTLARWNDVVFALTADAATAADSEPRGASIIRPKWTPGYRWRRKPSGVIVPTGLLLPKAA